MKIPDEADMNREEQQDLLFKCSQVFSPATPINTRDLFAGRVSQILLVGEAVNTRGRHAVIFGERGVGKTSLANVLKPFMENEETNVVKINCHGDDTFPKIWHNALSEIQLQEEEETAGFHPIKRLKTERASDVIDDNVGPSDVTRVLQLLSRTSRLVIIFDEFDRIKNKSVQRRFADTIKDLSDNSTNATLVIVGVANDVSELIKEHVSINRALVEIRMPRMEKGELKEILQKAMTELGTKMSDEAIELISLLSLGLPHYTHLLGSESTSHAILAGRKRIGLREARAGVEAALNKTQHSILEAYQNATRGQRKGTLFRQALLACALAEVDDQGYFVSAAVRDPLSKIMKKTYDIPGFSQHLDKFSSDNTRGPVLEKAGTTRRFRFRFMNPLLQPYVIMKGLADGALEGDLFELLSAKHHPA